MNINVQKVASNEVREQYCSRARDHFQRDAQVLETENACFWLTLAAGLGKSAWQINTQTQPGLADSVELLQQVRAMPLDSLDFLVIIMETSLWTCLGPGMIKKTFHLY